MSLCECAWVSVGKRVGKFVVVGGGVCLVLRVREWMGAWICGVLLCGCVDV